MRASLLDIARVAMPPLLHTVVETFDYLRDARVAGVGDQELDSLSIMSPRIQGQAT